GCVEGQDDRAAAVDRDDAAGAADSAQFVDDRARRLTERLAGIAQAGSDLERGTVANKKFAVPGRRDRAGGIVGVGAGANDRAVADPARSLAGHPAGRGGGGEIAVAVPGDGADGAMSGRLLAPSERVLQFPPAGFGAEIFRLGKG